MTKRKNGFECPWSAKQYIAVFLYVIYMIIYNEFIIEKLEHLYEQIMYSLFNTFLSVSLVLYFIVTLLDPGDFKSIDQTLDSQKSSMKTCSICNSYIYPLMKHCSVCNKCIYRYDHHCYWVNNCIGARNYKIYLLLVIAITISAIIGTVSCIIALIKYENYKFALVGKVLYLCFLSFFGILSIAITSYIGQILVFHIFISIKGITSYQYYSQIKAIKKPTTSNIRINLETSHDVINTDNR